MLSTNGTSTVAQPLIVAPADMAKVTDDKEAYGAVYKSTTDEISLQQNGESISLSKEEIKRFLNDPFWRKLRYGFIILFWLAWIGLFGLAILIVLASPKCPPKPDRHWWQKKVCYQIWTRSFKDSDGDGIGDIKGISEKLSVMSSSLRMNAIWPVPLLRSKSGSGYDVLDFKSIDPTLGKMADFEQLVTDVHSYDMRLIMDIPTTVVSTSHEWFVKSAAKTDDFEQYFAWSDRPVSGQNYKQHSNGRYYRTWGNRTSYALLNWNHEPVRRAMSDVFKFWMEKGVDGFYLGEVQYISLNEDDGKPAWDKIHRYVKNLTSFVKEVAKDSQILTFTSPGYKYEEAEYGVEIEELKTNLKLHSDVDYVINNELINADSSCRAECFYDHLNKVLKMQRDYNLTSWPMWEIGHPYVSRVASRLGSRDRADMALMLLMTLPGSVNVYYGDEIGMRDTDAPGVKKIDRPRAAMQWSDKRNGGASDAEKMAVPVHTDHSTINLDLQASNDSTYRMYKRLAGLRKSEDAYLYGGMKLGPRNNKLLMFKSTAGLSKIESEFITVLNFGDADTFNLASMNLTGKTGSVVSMTAKMARSGRFKSRDPVDLTKVPMGAEEGLLIRLRAA